MLKQLKRWGNNLVVVFTKEEETLYGLSEGDRLDLSDLVNKTKGGKKK